MKKKKIIISYIIDSCVIQTHFKLAKHRLCYFKKYDEIVNSHQHLGTNNLIISNKFYFVQYKPVQILI